MANFVLYVFYHKNVFVEQRKVAWCMAGAGKIKRAQRDLVSISIHLLILLPTVNVLAPPSDLYLSSPLSPPGLGLGLLLHDAIAIHWAPCFLSVVTAAQ